VIQIFSIHNLTDLIAFLIDLIGLFDFKSNNPMHTPTIQSKIGTHISVCLNGNRFGDSSTLGLAAIDG
jgi:hypothetical protein